MTRVTMMSEAELEEFAERNNVVVTICMHCKEYIEEKMVSGGVAGLSHGLCDRCYENCDDDGYLQ